MYHKVDVVVDQPASTLWHVIWSQFPDAQVILMERDSEESWVRSYRNMLTNYLQTHHPWIIWLYPESSSLSGVVSAWLSDTHNKLDRLARRNMIMSTAGVLFTC